MALPIDTAKLSPMMKQYLAVKNQNLDKILMYRLGDFYEMFFDDAIKVSRELELTLTGRDCGLEERAPMCGVPYHSVETYIGRLVAKGYKVAICEQMENPAAAKGIVKRDIVRVITPGTVTQDSMLSEERNNYVAVVYEEADGAGVCFGDISTGTCFVTEFVGGVDTIKSELARFSPREVIFNSKAFADKELQKFCSKELSATVDSLYDGCFELEYAKSIIMSSFEPKYYSSLSESRYGFAIKALGGLLKYLRDTQFGGASRMVTLDFYSVEEYLKIAPQCRKNLELTENIRSSDRKGTLLWVMDETVTSMGRRMLRSCIEKPLIDSRIINKRLDAVEELHSSIILRSKLREALRSVFDIERLMTRVTYRSCSPRDMIAFAATSKGLEGIKRIGLDFKSQLLQELVFDIDPQGELAARIEATIAEEPPALLKDGGYIKHGFSKEIDEIRELLHNTKNYLSKMEQDLKEKTGIKNLRVGYNKVFGYYIEVSKSNVDLVPDYFIRRQTLTTGERYITEEIKELENKILGGSERLNQLERQAFDDLCDAMLEKLKAIQSTAKAAAMLDVLCSFAHLAAENGYVRPRVDDSDIVFIKNGRHPVVEQVMNGELFVPNDTVLDCKDNMVNIITGPNMAGKSTYMRQTALIVIMAQMGAFVPAAEARIGVVDAIFTRIGSADNIFAGESTFMVEMKEVAYTLKNATRRSLLILDEIGRGTSTYDGMSIARAVIETICNEGGVGAKTMFATHYHELTELDTVYDCVRNYNIAAKKRGDDIVFLRRIVNGPADDSYGIEVAKLAGLPAETISAAKRALRDIAERAPEVKRSERNTLKDSELRKMKDIYMQIKDISVETLTPLEAMYLLNDLSVAANARDDEE